MHIKFVWQVYYNTKKYELQAVTQKMRKRAKYSINDNPRPLLPSFSDENATVSLRLGHAAALTPHRGVIHYRVAASLPREGGFRTDSFSIQ